MRSYIQFNLLLFVFKALYGQPASYSLSSRDLRLKSRATRLSRLLPLVSGIIFLSTLVSLPVVLFLRRVLWHISSPVPFIVCNSVRASGNFVFVVVVGFFPSNFLIFNDLFNPACLSLLLYSALAQLPVV